MNRGELYEALRTLKSQVRAEANAGKLNAALLNLLLQSIDDLQEKVTALWGKEAMWQRYSFQECEHSPELFHREIYAATQPIRDILAQMDDDGFDLSQLKQRMSVETHLATLRAMRDELVALVVHGGLCGVCHQQAMRDDLIMHHDCPIGGLNIAIQFYGGLS